METLRVGCKAYLDSFCGLVPCVVRSIADDWNVSVVLTATREAYKRGEIVITNSLHVIPRRSVFVRSGIYRIRGYNVEVQS